MTITCPNCAQQFHDDDTPSIEDGSDFTCPHCDASISVTLTWEVPEPERAA